jgi:hypothetical protein
MEKFYYVTAIIYEPEGKPWSCNFYDPIIGLDAAMDALERLREKHQVMAAWICDEDNKPVFVKDYINIVGNIEQPEGAKPTKRILSIYAENDMEPSGMGLFIVNSVKGKPEKGTFVSTQVFDPRETNEVTIRSIGGAISYSGGKDGVNVWGGWPVRTSQRYDDGTRIVKYYDPYTGKEIEKEAQPKDGTSVSKE